MVRIEVKIPTKLSMEERELYTKLSKLSKKKNHHLIYLNVSLKNSIIDLDFCKNLLDLFYPFE
ncbi:MAG: hypothetical protein ACLTAI_02830 [Thomasclavelia sp.]